MFMRMCVFVCVYICVHVYAHSWVCILLHLLVYAADAIHAHVTEQTHTHTASV